MSAAHTMKIDPMVKEVLQGATYGEDHLTLPPLDSKGYRAAMRVVSEFGGEWNKKRKVILIRPEDIARLREAVDAGVAPRERVILQKFYTPAAVADRLVAFALAGADLPRDASLLEPSAGGGALVAAALRAIPTLAVCCVDIDKAAASALDKRGHTTFNESFLKLSPDGLGRYHLILMNPPFQRGQAAAHVRHAMHFLADGGVLAAIVPRTFDLLLGGCTVADEDIEAGAFKESGTNIATKMIRAVKA